MDLDGIEVFVKVVEAGSFSQAAKLLGMPNSTVSAKAVGIGEAARCYLAATVDAQVARNAGGRDLLSAMRTGSGTIASGGK